MTTVSDRISRATDAANAAIERQTAAGNRFASALRRPGFPRRESRELTRACNEARRLIAESDAIDRAWLRVVKRRCR